MTFKDVANILSQNIGTKLPLCCVISQNTRDLTWHFGDTGIGWAPHCPVQSYQFWHSPVQHRIREFEMTSHI